jgi:hypothetical protein
MAWNSIQDESSRFTPPQQGQIQSAALGKRWKGFDREITILTRADCKAWVRPQSGIVSSKERPPCGRQGL